MSSFIIKYDYDDEYGFGAIIIFADDINDAIEKFKKYMFEKKDERWYEHCYRHSDFHHISTNPYGWNIFLNGPACVCLKVRKICDEHGSIIPIQEHFEM